MAPRKHLLTHVWHPDLHRKLAGEKLAYIWINLGYHFQRPTALREVKAILEKEGIRSYDIWGLYGDEDLLVKAYIPPEIDEDKFLVHLEESVRNPLVLRARPFIADVVWDQALKDEVSTSDFCELVDPSHLTQLHTGGSISAATMRLYQRNHFVLPVTATPTDIKFFMRVCAPDLDDGPASAASRVDSHVTKVVKTSARSLRGVGLYKGRGFNTRHLVTGRVKPTEWHRILQLLGDRIVSTDTLVKTITYFTSGPAPLERWDELPSQVCVPSAPPAKEISLDDLLLRDESELLEFKGSAFTDMEAWSSTGIWPSEQSKVVFAALAKSILGFLNARKGGHIVIGVLELAEFSPEKISAIRPDGYVAGENAAVGVEHEYKRIRKKRNFDGFQQKLRQMLDSAIEPSPGRSLRIHRETVGSVECCVVEVLEPKTWFWPKGGRENVLYVRRGNGTMPMTGKEMADYLTLE